MSGHERPVHGHPDFDVTRAIRALREQHGTAEQALALEQRLLAKLGPAALAGAGGAGGTLGHGVGLLLIGLCGLGLAAVYGHALLASRARERSAPEVRVQPVVRVQNALPAAVTAAQPNVAERLPDPVAPRVRHLRARKTATAPAIASASAPEPEPSAQDELRLLQRSRAALRTDPTTALALAEEHAREFPAGMFAQEREVLAIEALLRQRDRSGAFARAERFVAQHANSPYALRIRAMLEQAPREPVPAVPAEPNAPPGP